MNKQRTLDILHDNEHWSLYPLLGVQRSDKNGNVTKGVIIAGEMAVYEKDIATMNHEEPDHGLAAGCRLAEQVQDVIKHLYPSFTDMVEDGWDVPTSA